MQGNPVNWRLILLSIFILVPYNPLCYLHSCPSYPFIFLLKVRLAISIVSLTHTLFYLHLG